MNRAILLVAAIVLCASVSFWVLIQREANNMVSVHALDKAAHLASLLPRDTTLFLGDALANETSPAALGEFVMHAQSFYVASFYFLNLQGKQIARFAPDQWAIPHGATVDGLTQPQDVSGTAQTSSHHSAAHSPDKHTHELQSGTHATGHDHGHTAHGEHGHVSSKQFANVPVPQVRHLSDLLAGEAQELVLVGQLAEEGVRFAQVILPIVDESDALQGFVGIVMSVTHIHSSFRDSAASFGLLFVGFGVLFFGVPALGFWSQKKLVERSKRNVEYLSRHDPLTGLMNRAAFGKATLASIAAHQSGYLAYLDGDRFKVINDTYGHSVGDAFLQHIATALHKSLGPNAKLARLGGDEFSAFIPSTDADAMRSLSDRILSEIAKDVELEGYMISGTVSIGLAEAIPGEPLESLLHRADIALYDAKSNGGKRASFYTDEMGRAADRRRDLEALLRHATKSGGFELVYQPLVDATTSRTIGYEALLRLHDADGTQISPSEFVPLAEEAGLIEEMVSWVLQTATKEIARLDDTSTVSVNLSAEQFQSGRLLDVVKSALTEAELPPHRLELEITESMLLNHQAEIQFQIDTLKEMGISLAMDDFGTGYSSLSTLWRFSFDRIKIDKSFVQALEEDNARSKQMIKTIVMLGEHLGMKITAEGIETEEQRHALTQFGCDILQGFYLGRPGSLNAPAAQAAGQDIA